MGITRYQALLMVLAFLPGDSEKESSPLVFDDRTRGSGIDFHYESGTRGQYDLPEIMGGGIALIDVDGDGLLDLYFPNGGSIIPPSDVADSPSRMYRNKGNWTFTDITAGAGAPGPRYAMGVAVGDFDGDGRDDLLVTGWGEQRLYRNLGKGQFTDVTAAAGLESTRWGTSAAFADLDGDGDLDLYVGCYLTYDPTRAPYCAAPDGRRDYCGPEVFPAEADRLYRNNGDGTFTDISQVSGIAAHLGRALGVLVADLDGDGRLDLFVANDGSPSFLFVNQGGLRFEEIGQSAGVAVDRRGAAPAGMGVAFGDLDGDLRGELLVANFLGRGTLAFRSLGEGLYQDDSTGFGVSVPTISRTGFGLALADFDGDGDLDLIQASGHVLDRARLGEPMAMPLTLLHNEGGRFLDVTKAAGPAFARPVVGRGLTLGDLDNDGRVDAVVATLDGPPMLLRNETPPGNRLTLTLRANAPAAYGSSITVTAGDRTTRHDLPGGGSYLSAHDRRLFLGLGTARQADRITIRWPSGQVETWTDLPAGEATLQEGDGES